MQSTNYLAWQIRFNRRLCMRCLSFQGKIYEKNNITDMIPPMHPNCKCFLIPLQTKIAGTVTNLWENGADWWLVYRGELPDYYITTKEAKANGWQPIMGNLQEVLPGKMIMGGVYKNKNKHLPDALGRVWYEADIDYDGGYRGLSRVVFSNDGLVFGTYDHYFTFFEIVPIGEIIEVEKGRKVEMERDIEKELRELAHRLKGERSKTHPEEWYAFKPITENPIRLDFGKCIYPWDVHGILKEKFGLPEYYGYNWDALWDCLRDLFDDMGIIKVEIYNFSGMGEELQEMCQPMLEVFEDVHNETPNFIYEVIS